MQIQANNLQTPIEFLKGVGPAKAESLRLELNIFTFRELLLYYPFRYIDRSVIHKVKDIDEEMPAVQLIGVLENVHEAGMARQKRLTANFRDETGVIELVWFQGVTWLKSSLKQGMRYVIYGKPVPFKNTFSIAHPDIELFVNPQQLQGGLQPVYHSTEKLKRKGLDSKGIEKLVKAMLPQILSQVQENLPQEIIKACKLISRQEALRHVHFPSSFEMMEQARRRLKFEELFFHQFRLLQFKVERHEKIKGHVFSAVKDNFNEFYHNHLPFNLTNAQKRVLKEIWGDMKSGKQMNRLLQGDVGSGKTIVALLSMLMSVDNQMQACLMAPTEILAQQHYLNISSLLEKMNIKVRLLTGSTPAADRKIIHQELQGGELEIIIGTHALIEETVKFSSLGLVIIDEQHRFGVEQRAKLWRKNEVPPHVLVMTATPIPRTLAMTLYGDLDVSVIDELPPGRKPIDTRHVYEKDRLKVFGFLKNQLAQGRQVYIVYPLIDESETLDYNNLMEGYESIRREFEPLGYAIGMVHGRMKPADKELEMKWFKQANTHVLVSTTVIEVGVDVPNASVMVIENAERFGLSQLHQLRGRVGRGGEKSYCILLTSYKLSKDGKVRMETMVRTNNGFEIAEVDLNLRGPGEVAGTRQTGRDVFTIADLTTDLPILKLARHAALKIAEDDSHLQKPENLPLRNFLHEMEKLKTNWSRIS